MQDNQEKCKELSNTTFITWTKKFINVWVPLWDVHLQDKKKQLSVIWQR